MSLKDQGLTFREISICLGLPQDNIDPGKRVRNYYRLVCNPSLSQARPTIEQREILIGLVAVYLEDGQQISWPTIAKNMEEKCGIPFTTIALKNSYYSYLRSTERKAAAQERKAAKARKAR